MIRFPIPLPRLLLPLVAPLIVIPAVVEVLTPSVSSISALPGNIEADGMYFLLDNYMDYSYDSCMTEFTPGQITRLTSQLATYRGL